MTHHATGIDAYCRINRQPETKKAAPNLDAAFANVDPGRGPDQGLHPSLPQLIQVIHPIHLHSGDRSFAHRLLNMQRAEF